MKFTWKVRYLSAPIEVGKDEKKTTKQVLCLEEVAEKERLDSMAIDVIGDNVVLLDWVSLWDVVTVNYNHNYNRWTNDAGKESIFNSLRLWKITIDEKGRWDDWIHLEENASETKKKEEDDSWLPF